MSAQNNNFVIWVSKPLVRIIKIRRDVGDHIVWLQIQQYKAIDNFIKVVFGFFVLFFVFVIFNSITRIPPYQKRYDDVKKNIYPSRPCVFSFIYRVVKDILRDRMAGCLYGQAVGDALGLGTEFLSKDEISKYYPQGLSRYEQFIQDKHRSKSIKGACPIQEH